MRRRAKRRVPTPRRARGRIAARGRAGNLIGKGQVVYRDLMFPPEDDIQSVKLLGRGARFGAKAMTGLLSSRRNSASRLIEVATNPGTRA